MKVKNKLKPLTIEFCKRFLVCKMGSAKGHLMFAKKRNGESFTALDYWDKLHLMANQDLVTMLLGSGKKVDIMEQASFAYRTESGRPLEQADKNEYILRPDGSKAFGYITKEIEKATNGELVAGEIRLKVGDDKEGLIHAKKHLKQIQYCGYNSVEDFVADTASGFDAIFRRTDKSGRISYNIVKLKRSEKDKNNVIGVALRIQKNVDGNYYVVLTAIPKKDKSLKREIKKEKCVYCSPGIAATTFPNIGAVPTSAANEVGSGSDASPASDKHIPQIVDILTETDSDVKQNKLIALHNISQEKLAKSLELGGLPMPSIAIMQDGTNFVNFGDITFVVPKEVIDPKNGADVFDKDAYTTRVPSPEYRSFKDKNLKPWVSKWVPIFKRFGKERWFFDEIIYSLRNYVDVSAIGKFFSHEIVKYHYLTDILGIKVDLADNTDGSVYAAVRNKKYDKYFNDAKFSKWVQEETESFAGKPVLKVGSKYVDYNLENIVKAMKKKSGRGKEKNVIYTNGTVAAMLSHKFKSIKEMHDYALELGTRAEMEQGKERSGDLVEAYCTGAVAYRDKGISVFDAYDEAMGCLADSVVKEKIDKKRLKEKLEQAGLFKDVPDDVLDLGVEAGKALKETQTEYFEAKPARAVKFEEITGAVVPDTVGKDIVEKLKEKEIDVVVYDSKKAGDRERALNDVLMAHPEVYFQSSANGTQAQSAFLGNNVANVERFVNLLKDADITTFFHEAGHIFFVDLMMLGQNPLATEQMKRDWETVLKWTEWDENQLKEYENTAAYGQMAEIDNAIRNAKDKDSREAALNRWRQERWARAVEDYCIKGDVPSEGLRKALSNIKKWLVKVYRMLRGAGVPMSKEVKDVMDRMLASKEAVELAAAKAGLEDFRRQGGLDMASDSAKEMWLKLYDEAKERAEAKVRALAMGDLEEERQVQMEEARARERERATKMFQNTRHFRAKAYLDATPNIDRNLVLAKFSLTPEEYERDVANDGDSVENAVAKYMKDVYEPVLQKEFYVTQAQMQKKAEEALQEPKYRAVVTAFEGEILESYNKRFHRLAAKLEKEGAERVRQKREAQAAVVKQNIQNLLDTLTPARVRGMAEDANIPEDLDKIPKEGLLDRVKNWLKNIIGKNITDPLGNKVHFAPKEGETEEHYALHLLAGKDNAGVEDVESRRAIGVMLAERTIKRPWAVVTQENGRKLYMSIYKGRSGNIAEQVVVAVEDGEDGVVITSFPTIDKGLKNTALSEFKRRVKNAKNLDYFGGPAMGYSREPYNGQTSNGSTPSAAVTDNSIADLDTDVNNLTPQEKRARREELHKETIRQLKEELKSARQATRRAALEVVRNCRKYAARRMEDLPVSESGDFCKKNFSKSS